MSILLFIGVILSILGLFAYSLATLIRDKRILIWPNLIQPILFCWLYYLIYIYLGPNYYKFDHEPELWDWMQFTLAHMLRATDILDVIEEFHIDIQNVKHASNLVATTVMLMHWIMDIFLLGLLWRFISNYWESKYFKLLNSNNLLIGLTVLIFIALSLTILTQAQSKGESTPWIILNLILLWPLDNIIRVIDVGDSFQLYNIRLHQLDLTLWTVSLAVAFRLIISFPIGRGLNILHHEYFGGALKTLEDLIEELGADDTSDHAIEALMQAGAIAAPKLLCTVGDSNLNMQKGSIKCLHRLDADAIKTAFGALDSTAQSLAINGLSHALTIPDDIVQQHAAEIIGYLGAKAQTAIPTLIQILGETDLEVRETATQTLQRIDAAWTKHTALGSAIFALAKTLIIQNSSNKKIDPVIQSRIDAECKLIVQNLTQAIIKSGINLSIREAKYIRVGLIVGLAKKDAASRKSIIKRLENTNSAAAIIKLLAQILTDVEVKKREKQKIIKTQLAAAKQLAKQREQTREQAKQWLPVLKLLFKAWIVAILGLQIYQVLFAHAGTQYQIHDNGTVTDTKAGLMWKRCSEGQEWDGTTCTGDASTMSWNEAMPNEKQKSWPTFAGYSNWRMPTKKELSGLIRCNKKSKDQPFCNEYPQASINETVFPNTPVFASSLCQSSMFWTSSLYEKNYIMALVVAFRPEVGEMQGIANRSLDDCAFIRLVRDE